MFKEFNYNTTSDIDVINITDDVKNFVSSSKVKEGMVLIHVDGSTASISTIEYEPGLIIDIKEALLKLFPKNHDYKHHETWNDGNGYSHIMATFLKPSITVPVINGKLKLGTWQQIILMDFDNKPRKRNLTFMI
jgi:secondary thiamine-phosphate synthase enzyme